MIDVYLYKVNSVLLKGQCVEEINVFLSPKGWTATVLFKRETHRPLCRVEGKTRKEILPAIQDILEEWRESEEFNNGEIGFYLDIIQAKFGRSND
jgi:hypothetical protein